MNTSDFLKDPHLHRAPSSSGLGHWPLTPVTGVRVPLGSPHTQKAFDRHCRKPFAVFEPGVSPCTANVGCRVGEVLAYPQLFASLPRR